MHRLALAEARLVTAKLLWHFDMELDGDHSSWVQDARFYVSRFAGGGVALKYVLILYSRFCGSYSLLRCASLRFGRDRSTVP
jgi:hypothetical protein